jgi:hypothetical protein
MKAFRVLVAMAVVALFAATATAERLARQVSDVTPTADPRGGSRILFRWDATLAEGEVAVRRAVLRFTLAGVAQETTLTLRVYPVTAAWSGGQGAVSYDADLWSHAEIDLRQSGTVGVDVTNIVKEIVEEGLTTYGFEHIERARLAGAVQAFVLGEARAELHLFAQRVERINQAIDDATDQEVEAVGSEVDRSQCFVSRHAPGTVAPACRARKLPLSSPCNLRTGFSWVE